MFEEDTELFRELVREGLDVPPGSLRAWLESRLGEDRERADRVRAAIDAERAMTFADAAGAEDGEDAPRCGHRVGPFVIKGVLGEGGMGTVYLAEQEAPRREVALKVMRSGLMTPRLRRRFEVESEVLGRLEHPHIARIYQAGTTGEGSREGTGEPWFAMEVVRGLPIDRHVRLRELDARRRAELFLQVCDAVHHAHQRGVIHRDLKPANILVEDAGEAGSDAGLGLGVGVGLGVGRVKVLDFGVARAVEADLRVTVETGAGGLVGTLPYMSPEQVRGDLAAVDVRSDVYTLGVVLHEVLSGRLPYEVGGRTVVEASRVIEEAEPTRLGRLDPSLRGDLETIVLKALEKEPERRYQSAAELGADLRRWLRDEPVEARPASGWYRARKFARRNRALVGGAASAFALLVAGVVGTSAGMARAVEARGLAEREAERARSAAADAEREAAISRAKSDFLINRMLLAVTPEEAMGREVTAREVFAAAAGAVDEAFAERPVVLGSLRTTLGRALLAVGDPEGAEASLRAAVAALERAGAIDGPEGVEARQNLVSTLFRRGRYAECAALAERLAAEIAERDPRDRAVYELRSAAASALHNLGERDRALGLLEAAHAECSAVLGAEHEQTQSLAINLAYALEDAGRGREALPLYEGVARAREAALGAEHPRTLVALNNLAACQYGLGRAGEAAETTARVYEASVRVRGAEHPDTNLVRSNLAFLRQQAGDVEGAAALFREGIAVAERTTGLRTIDAATMQDNLAMALGMLGRFEESRSVHAAALETMTDLLGADHPETLNTRFSQGRVLLMARDPGAAGFWEAFVPRLEGALGGEHRLTAHGWLRLAEARGQAGDADGSRRAAREAERRLAASVGPEHPLTARARELGAAPADQERGFGAE